MGQSYEIKKAIITNVAPIKRDMENSYQNTTMLIQAIDNLTNKSNIIQDNVNKLTNQNYTIQDTSN
jgi:hypothetical protein